MKKTYLITGGAGFIASTLIDKLLKENINIITIDNFDEYYSRDIKEDNIKNALKNPNYKLYQGDICDSELLNKILTENKIDTVIHIAAKAGVRNSFENPLGYIESNLKGTVNILEQMKIHGVNKLVFASSSSVYGNCNAKKFSEELKDINPISPYAVTKLACEKLIYTYSKCYDINSVCLRFFTVYGPRQRPDLAINKFVNLICNNEAIPVYGDGTTIRDYTYISDIVDGICSAIDYNKTPYEIINLGGGSPISLLELIETIENILGKKARLDFVGMQKGDVLKTVSDISKAKELLGYSPKVNLEEGIRKFVEWRENEFKK